VSLAPEGAGRSGALEDLCFEIFARGVRPETSTVARDLLAACLRADEARRRWDEACADRRSPAKVAVLAAEARAARHEVDALRTALKGPFAIR
jgi:hypothetical protein